MDYNELNIEIDNFFNNFKGTDIYKNYEKLVNDIKNKYSNEIEEYKKAKLNLDNVLEYNKYHPDYHKYLNEYKNKKTILYEKKEIKLYFSYIHKLEDYYNNILKEIKKDILEENL